MDYTGITAETLRRVLTKQEFWVRTVVAGAKGIRVGRRAVLGFECNIRNFQGFVFRDGEGQWILCDMRTGVEIVKAQSRMAATVAARQLLRAGEIFASIAQEPDVMDLPE